MKEWKNIAIMTATEMIILLGAFLLWLAYVSLTVIAISMIFVFILSLFLFNLLCLSCSKDKYIAYPEH
jgi:hypothetical protein